MVPLPFQLLVLFLPSKFLRRPGAAMTTRDTDGPLEQTLATVGCSNVHNGSVRIVDAIVLFAGTRSSCNKYVNCDACKFALANIPPISMSVHIGVVAYKCTDRS